MLIHSTRNLQIHMHRIRKFTDRSPNTDFYGLAGDQSECRILESHVINSYIISQFGIFKQKVEGKFEYFSIQFKDCMLVVLQRGSINFI